MSEPGSEGQKSRLRHRLETLGIVGVVLIVIALWVACGFLLPGFIPQWVTTDLLEKSGQFGDTFGAANALFSGLAMVGVAIAVYYQRHELEIARDQARKSDEARHQAGIRQQEELEIVRDEARKSDEARRNAESALADQIDALHATAKLNAASSIIQANDSIARLAADIEKGDRQPLSRGPWRELDEIRLYRQYLIARLHGLPGESAGRRDLICDYCISWIDDNEASWRDELTRKTAAESPTTNVGWDQLDALRRELGTAKRQPGVAGTFLARTLHEAINRIDEILKELGKGGVELRTIEQLFQNVRHAIQQSRNIQ
jgi:hypothetical protein